MSRRNPFVNDKLNDSAIIKLNATATSACRQPPTANRLPPLGDLAILVSYLVSQAFLICGVSVGLLSRWPNQAFSHKMLSRVQWGRELPLVSKI